MQSRSDGSTIALLLAGLGATVAIMAVFLPEADTESSLHIAKNSLIQHGEGVAVVLVALAGFFSALRSGSGRGRRGGHRIFAGAVLIAFAVIGGIHAKDMVHYRNELSESVAGNVSPGAGIWALGIGGVLLAISGLVGDSGPSLGVNENADAEAGGGMAAELARLDELHRSGALSAPEFATAKARMLGAQAHGPSASPEVDLTETARKLGLSPDDPAVLGDLQTIRDAGETDAD